MVLAAVPDLAWCLLPSEPHSEKAHPNSPPQINLEIKAKGTDQDPGTTQHRGQFAPNLNKGKLTSVLVSLSTNKNHKHIHNGSSCSFAD